MKRSHRISIAALMLLLTAGWFAPAAIGSVHHPAPATRRLAPDSQPQAVYRLYLPIIRTPGLFQNVANGDRVAQTTTVIGTYSLTLTNDLWIFVVPSSNKRFYPQSPNACAGERTPKVNGKWEMRVGFGDSANAGENFDLLLTWATPPASQSIIETLKAWCVAKDYPGFATLPTGLTTLERITVTRMAERWGPAPLISSDTLTGTVTIASLVDKDEVDQDEIVTGTYSLDVANDIWLLIYAPNGRWYPQSYDACNGDHIHKANGVWEARVTFGQPENAGEPFDIVMILANRAASEALALKQQEWCKANDYKGWLTIELPQKLDEKQRIRVKRK